MGSPEPQTIGSRNSIAPPGDASGEHEPDEARPRRFSSTAPTYFFTADTAMDGREESVWLFSDIDMKDTDLEAVKEDMVPSYWFIISPWSVQRIMWDVVALLLTLSDAYMTTFELSFLTVWADGLPTAWEVISWTITSFFMVDIGLNFITGQVQNGHPIMKLPKIVYYYATSWFVLDLLATIPWDRLFGGGSGDVGGTTAVRFGRFNRSFRLIKFIRLLRLLRIMRSISKAGLLLSRMHGRPRMRQLLTLVGYLLAFSFVCHFDACIYHVLEPETLNSSDTLGDAYVASVYWVWNHLLTTSPFDEPTKAGVRIFSMVMGAQSMILLAGGLAKVTTLVVSMNEAESKRSEDLNAANDFMQANSVDLVLQLKVQRFLRQARRARIADMQHLLADSPLLYEQLCLDLHGSTLRSFPLVLDLENEETAGALLVSKLAVRISKRTWAPNEVIFAKGDPADTMLIVVEGVVRVLQACLASNKHVKPKLRTPCCSSECSCNLDLLFPAGTWLGEKSLFFESACRHNMARSDAFTTVLVLRGEDFRDVCAKLKLSEKINQLTQGFLSAESFQSAGCPFCKSRGHWGNECMHVIYQEVGTPLKPPPKAGPGQQLGPRRLLDVSLPGKRQGEQFAGLGEVLAAEGFEGGLDDPLLKGLTPDDVTRVFGARGLRAADLARLRQASLSLHV